MDQHCRITVVGERRTVDLAVPAGAPIVSYVDTLARICDQDENDILPAAWTLGAATGSAFAPEWSLAELGISDGQVLYLRDAAADELADPVVHDVAERVGEASQGALDHRWDARPRTFAVVGLGLAWLVAGLLALALRHGTGHGALAEPSLGAGLALPVLAWVAMERRWPVPAALRMALALAAVPLLALAAWSAAAAYGPARLGLEGSVGPAWLCGAAVALGCLVGAVLATVAAPSVVTSALPFVSAVAAVLTVALALLRADAYQAASVLAVTAFGLLTVLPATVSGTVAFAWRRVSARVQTEPDEDEVGRALRSATVLLVVWNAVLCAGLAWSLATMAASTSPYADTAAGLLAAALLLRAGSARLVAEVVPQLAAGLAGFAALLLAGPGHFGWPGWTAPLFVCLAGGLLLLYGFRRMMRRPGLPAMERPRWLTPLASWLAGGSVALAVATFGAFGAIVQLGHHI